MTYTEIQNVNITGIDDIFVYVSSTLTWFIPMLLFAIFLGMGAAIYYGTKRANGQADIYSAFAASGFVAFTLGTIFTLVSGIINAPTLISAAILLILSILALFVSRRTG